MIVADLEIDGLLLGLKVNGVDVVPLVQAELDRRHPELPQIRSDDPDELREGWATIRRTWAQTMARADALPAEQVRVEVADEWSFADTLRHLIFATDAWISRPILGDPQPTGPADWVPPTCHRGSPPLRNSRMPPPATPTSWRPERSG